MSKPRKYLTMTDIEKVIKDEYYHCPPDSTITICMLTLKNGAKVVGVNYGAIDASRHNAKTGQIEARHAAVEQIWQLEGYLMHSKLTGQISLFSD